MVSSLFTLTAGIIINNDYLSCSIHRYSGNLCSKLIIFSTSDMKHRTPSHSP